MLGRGIGLPNYFRGRSRIRRRMNHVCYRGGQLGSSASDKLSEFVVVYNEILEEIGSLGQNTAFA
jgi:hypothetical protein